MSVTQRITILTDTKIDMLVLLREVPRRKDSMHLGVDTQIVAEVT